MSRLSGMADKMIGELLETLIEIIAERLIVYFQLENAYEIAVSFGGLALMIGGGIALWMGWL